MTGRPAGLQVTGLQWMLCLEQNLPGLGSGGDRIKMGFSRQAMERFGLWQANELEMVGEANRAPMGMRVEKMVN